MLTHVLLVLAYIMFSLTVATRQYNTLKFLEDGQALTKYVLLSSIAAVAPGVVLCICVIFQKRNLYIFLLLYLIGLGILGGCLAGVLNWVKTRVIAQRPLEHSPDLKDLLRNMANYDITLSVDFFEWVIKQFLSYNDHSHAIFDVLENLSMFPDSFRNKLVERINNEPAFCAVIMTSSRCAKEISAELVYTALRKGSSEAEGATQMLAYYLSNQFVDTAVFCDMIDLLIDKCRTDINPLAMKAFIKELFPHICSISLPAIQEKLFAWAKIIDEYNSIQESVTT